MIHLETWHQHIDTLTLAMQNSEVSPVGVDRAKESVASRTKLYRRFACGGSGVTPLPLLLSLTVLIPRALSSPCKPAHQSVVLLNSLDYRVITCGLPYTNSLKCFSVFDCKSAASDSTFSV